ncbi:pilus assembly protein [Corallococcus sp. CA053C]|uniref:TadE/TadG family type IV pilus assembly protein n=1 Tax=Corallococcus sp. CA053C TaxID=2316732 RepID=UPI000EA1D432|nr:TadE family protein [Corallococcus sp. CA053C]RKH11482.1 pilus assembly protein [Corallococcus sp. CA053C]
MKWSASPHPGESGQALVESALVFPVMVFLILGILQLGTLHHARLMTEYAAYRSARAGIVNHGDCEIMKKAAYVAVLPTLGPPRVPMTGVAKPGGRVDTLINVALVNDAYTDKSSAQANQTFKDQGVDLERVRVEVLNPRKSQLPGLFASYGSHMKGLELDYDDIRNAQVIDANLLTVRVTYFYEMRIPFANWQLHAFYMGREFLKDIRGGPNFTTQRVGGGSPTQYLETKGASRSADHKKVSTLAGMQTFVIPVIATYSMRMQSNLLNSGTYGPNSCAVDG